MQPDSGGRGDAQPAPPGYSSPSLLCSADSGPRAQCSPSQRSSSEHRWLLGSLPWAPPCWAGPWVEAMRSHPGSVLAERGADEGKVLQPLPVPLPPRQPRGRHWTGFPPGTREALGAHSRSGSAMRLRLLGGNDRKGHAGRGFSAGAAALGPPPPPPQGLPGCWFNLYLIHSTVVWSKTQNLYEEHTGDPPGLSDPVVSCMSSSSDFPRANNNDSVLSFFPLADTEG